MGSSTNFSLSSNSYSFLYRLIDLCVLFCSLPLAAALYGVALDREYLMAALIVSVFFLYVAESFDLYRSWRADRFSVMVLIAWACLTISFLMGLALAFLLKQSDDFSRVTIVLWFFLALVMSFLWRALQRQYVKFRRRAGHNIKRVAIIGVTEPGDTLLKEIKKVR